MDSPHAVEPDRKRRGRPPGSKNKKPKDPDAAPLSDVPNPPDQETTSTPGPKRRGRPLGSKNKKPRDGVDHNQKSAAGSAPSAGKGRGRPLGSKNKKDRTSAGSTDAAGSGLKRRGRPLGSKNKTKDADGEDDETPKPGSSKRTTDEMFGSSDEESPDAGPEPSFKRIRSLVPGLRNEWPPSELHDTDGSGIEDSDAVGDPA